MVIAAWPTLRRVGSSRFGIIGEVRLYSNGTGVWRSLVARFVRDEEAVGSNPATPTGNRRDRLVPAIFVYRVRAFNRITTTTETLVRLRGHPPSTHQGVLHEAPHCCCTRHRPPTPRHDRLFHRIEDLLLRGAFRPPEGSRANRSQSSPKPTRRLPRRSPTQR